MGQDAGAGLEELLRQLRAHVQDDDALRILDEATDRLTELRNELRSLQRARRVRRTQDWTRSFSWNGAKSSPSPSTKAEAVAQTPTAAHKGESSEQSPETSDATEPPQTTEADAEAARQDAARKEAGLDTSMYPPEVQSLVAEIYERARRGDTLPVLADEWKADIAQPRVRHAEEKSSPSPRGNNKKNGSGSDPWADCPPSPSAHNTQ